MSSAGGQGPDGGRHPRGHPGRRGDGGPAAKRSGAGATGVVVLDVDGVVADVRHRLRHLDPGRRNWAAFFAEAGADPPLPEGVALARALATEHEVVWLTGRPERLRAVTLRWMSDHLLPAGRLVMRPDGDRRPARQFKRAALRRLRRTDLIVLVVDDDPDVAAMAEQEGLAVHLARWVPRTRALDVAQEHDGRT